MCICRAELHIKTWQIHIVVAAAWDSMVWFSGTCSPERYSQSFGSNFILGDGPWWVWNPGWVRFCAVWTCTASSTGHCGWNECTGSLQGEKGKKRCWRGLPWWEDFPWWDFTGGPMAKTVLPMQGVQVWSLVRKLAPTAATKDPTCCNGDQRSCMLQLRPCAAK